MASRQRLDSFVRRFRRSSLDCAADGYGAVQVQRPDYCAFNVALPCLSFLHIGASQSGDGNHWKFSHHRGGRLGGLENSFDFANCRPFSFIRGRVGIICERSNFSISVQQMSYCLISVVHSLLGTLGDLKRDSPPFVPLLGPDASNPARTCKFLPTVTFFHVPGSSNDSGLSQ